MSLLEDVFLQDEADEAQELERIIEGDDVEDERPNQDDNSDENSEKKDEAIEDKRKVDPSSTKTKRVVKNPRVILNPARLTGPRGIQVIPDHFKDFKFKGKGHEKEDLDLVLKKLEHWAYRLFPKFQFEDCLKKIETLGKKRPVMVHLHKIRSDQLLTEETVVQKDSSDEEPVQQVEDEFDKLLQQQIDLARATPAPDSVKKPGVTSTPLVDKRSSLMMPKATSSPSISDEQKERMMRNRKLAEERRLARIKAQNTVQSEPNADVIENTQNDVEIESNNANDTRKNRNVIDSSEDEIDLPRLHQAISVDIHRNNDVIDITEGYQRHRKIINNEMIDLSNVDEETVHKNKTYNKSNVIESSDDEADMEQAVDKNVIEIEGYQRKSKIINNEMIDLSNVDEETGHKNKNHNKSNVIESSDDEADDESYVGQAVDKNVIDIDITNKNHIDNELANLDVDEDLNVNMKHNKSNVIDSSDDDDVNISRVDQTITADIHDSVGNKKGGVIMDVETEKPVELDNIITHSDEIQSEDTYNHSESTKNPKCNGNVVEYVNVAEVNTDSINMVKNNTPKMQNTAIDKENVDNNVFNTDLVDDIMDVDFSDDF